MLKYLKDQGGQFWGAFAKSYGKTIKEERDRPLKEAMMKAQIGQAEAVAKKAQMDVDESMRQQQAVAELAQILQPQQVEMPTAGPVEESGKAPAPAMVTQPGPQMTDPRVRAALLKADPKQGVTQAAKAAFPSGSMATDKFGVDSMAEATAMEQDPNFKLMFPHGHRWEVKNGKLVPTGMNPVSVANNIYHSALAAGKSQQEAQALYNNALYGGSFSSGMGSEGGKAAAVVPSTNIPPPPQIGNTAQPSAPAAPIAPAAPPAATQPSPGGAPQQVSPGVAIPPRQSGETDAMYAARLKSLQGARGKDQAQAEEQLIALADAKTMLCEL